jgi:hypothetical protein
MGLTPPNITFRFLMQKGIKNIGDSAQLGNINKTPKTNGNVWIT